MNKLFSIMMSVFIASAVNAQEQVGLNFYNIPGTSVEVVSVQEHCRISTTEGTCTMSIQYKSEVFPVRFIQDDKVLETIDSIDSAIGFEAIQGVKYKVLPNGGLEYMLEIRNPRGATFIMTTIGS